jgi:acyl-coenzyme A synthetase/AMP-(fatty) acid ligase
MACMSTPARASNPFSQRLHEVLSSGSAAPALLFRERWYSWQELHADWKAIQALIEAAGVPQDAALAYVARTRVQHAALIVGALAEGRTLATIYALQSPTLIAKDIAALGAAVVIADPEDWTPEAIAAARAAGSAGIAIANPAPGAGPRVSAVAGLERCGPGPHRKAGAQHDVELLSSGTTGAPKRIRLPVAGLMRAVTSLTLGGETKREVAILQLPFSSIGGLMSLGAAAFQASTIILFEKFNVQAYVDAVRTYKVRTLGGPSAVFRHILEAKIPREDLASVEYCFGGSDRLEPETQKRFEEIYGIPVLWGYGATEFAGTVVTWTPALRKQFGDTKPGSIGRALVGAEVRVVNPDTGAEVPRGEMGNLEAKIELLGPDWIRSTDLATMDSDGFVFLHGRADGAILRGGFKILPERVATVLRQHPAVRDAAVIGLPDPILGQVPVAAIERRAGAQAPLAAELEKLVRDNLPSHHVPKRFVIVDALPRTGSLKVRLAELPALFD